MARKVLITGGCGFLGSNIASEALRHGDEVLLLDNLYREGSRQNLTWLRKAASPQFVQADVRDKAKLEEVFSSFRPDAVFHLAGQVAMTTSLSDPVMDFEVNAQGSVNVLDCVRRLSPDATVVYSSTNKVYGDLGWVRIQEKPTRYVAPDYPDGFGEKLPLDFESPYGCSKGAADQYMLDFHRMYGLKTVVFRHSSMFGERQFATYDQGWLGWFCQKALEQKAGKAREPFTISGNGKQVRDVLFSTDMVALYLCALEKAKNAAGEAFNIGGGMENSLSLLELFEMLEKKLGVRLEHTQLPFRRSDQKVFVADISKARKCFGWKPTIPKEEGISRMLAWLSAQKA
jgi:CDP-paratose 2-epimerase